MADVSIIRGKTLPDSGIKNDLHELIDLATGTVSNIVNTDIKSSAAIAGSKISPNFGSQDVVCAKVTASDDVAISGSASIGTNLDLRGELQFATSAGTDGQVATSAGSGSDTVWATPSSISYDGTKVYDAEPAAINTWTDLDLSSYVGSNRALVFIKIKTAEAKGLYVASRPNGDTDEWGTGSSLTSISYAATLSTAGDSAMFCVWTDAAGVIEWTQRNATCDAEYYLLGYAK